MNQKITNILMIPIMIFMIIQYIIIGIISLIGIAISKIFTNEENILHYSFKHCVKEGKYIFNIYFGD